MKHFYDHSNTFVTAGNFPPRHHGEIILITVDILPLSNVLADKAYTLAEYITNFNNIIVNYRIVNVTDRI